MINNQTLQQTSDFLEHAGLSGSVITVTGGGGQFKSQLQNYRIVTQGIELLFKNGQHIVWQASQLRSIKITGNSLSFLAIDQRASVNLTL